jgi:hypothetical protein
LGIAVTETEGAFQFLVQTFSCRGVWAPKVTLIGIKGELLMEVTMMEGMLSFHFDIRDTRVHQGASDIEISQALVCADANKEKHNV